MGTTKTATARPAVSCAIEEITPAKAKQMLAINHANRRLIDSGVERLQGVITRGEWMEDSTDGIGLDVDGGVVNGQHRLTAIANGTSTVRALVVRNVRPEVIKVIDQGLPRNLTQILQMTGKYEFCSDLSGAISWLWRIFTDSEKSQPVAQRPSVPQLLEFFGQHPHLVDSVRVAVDTNRSAKGFQTSGLAAFHYVMATVDDVAADEFFSKLETGAEISPGDPVHSLREKALANAIATKRESPVVVLAWLVKAWEAEREGKALQKANLRWKSSGARAEDFPKVGGIGFDPVGTLVVGDEEAA